MGFGWLAAQNPIAMIPPVPMDGESTRCLFLYPAIHDSFLYHKPVVKGDSLKGVTMDFTSPRVAIPDDAHPIPVLTTAREGLIWAEQRVTLEAVVSELPSELAGRFHALYANHYDPRVLSNFLLLRREPPVSFCLDTTARERDTGAHVEKSIQAADRALLYVEGHVEGAGEQDLLDRLEQAIGQQAGLVSRGGLQYQIGAVKQPYRIMGAVEDMTVMMKAPNVVGLYAETCPTQDLVTRADQLREATALLRSAVGSAGAVVGLPLEFRLDFLFDFERQRQFEQTGVLSSEAALQALRGEDELQATRHWLRDAGGQEVD